MHVRCKVESLAQSSGSNLVLTLVVSVVVLVVLAFVGMTGLVQAGSDVEGSEDHPLVSRFPEARIVFYDRAEYDAYTIPLGSVYRERDAEHNLVTQLTDSKLAAGAITRIQYEVPANRSPEEIFRSYEQAFQEAGLETLYAASGAELGSNFGPFVYPESLFLTGVRSSRDVSYWVGSDTDHQRFLAAKLPDPDGDVYVTMFTGISIHKPEPFVQLEVVESQPMAAGQIAVNPDFPRDIQERQSFDPSDDVDGAGDHPLVSRYAGTRIVFFDEAQYDSTTIPLGPVESYRDEAQNLIREFSDGIQVEGKITRLQYEAPGDRSLLEIIRNYEAALTQAGFDILFEGAGTDLGSHFGPLAFPADIFSSGVRSTADVSYYVRGDGSQQRYLAAKLPSMDGDLYVAVFAAISIHKPQPAIQLEIVEMLPMEGDLVAVDAEFLGDELARVGFVALHGIHFETDSDVMRPDSRPALDQLAAMLGYHADLDVFVVGHTDSVGRYEYNLDLSQRRAESIVNELVQHYDITAERLTPVGIGPVSPVASNATEAGRARNRRVELVVR